MYEIVIVRNAYYEQGAEVDAERLIAHSRERKRLWWFNGPYTDKDLGLAMKPHSSGLISTMKCEAIWFEFEFVPNLRELEHFQTGSSYMWDEFEYGRGFELFEESLPEIIDIIRRKLKESDCPPFFADTDFYALYDVEVDEYRDEDGGLDALDVIPTLIGELDFSKLALAVVPMNEAEAHEE